jgi:hypothetical protein
MKTKSVLFSVLIAALFNSCDVVDGPYGVPIINGGTDTNTVINKVLVEDFTGHTCKFCPNAHREAERLQAIYGKRILVLGNHSGPFAKPEVTSGGIPIYPDSSFIYDFRNTISTAISTDFGIIALGYPKGMVNRSKDNSNNLILEWSAWEGAIDKALAKPVLAGLKMTTTYDAGSKNISCSIVTEVLQDMTDNLQLAMYIVEDSIVNWQKDGTVKERNYMHRHVLRGSLNGEYGVDLGAGLLEGTKITKTASATLLPADANPTHVSIYAVLTNAVTKEVIQVEEQKIIP